MLVIVLVGWTSYRQTSSLIENSSWISHTQEVIGDVYELQSKLEQAEGTQGRYLITGDESFLDSFQKDARTAKELEQTLLHLTAYNPQQQRRLRELDRLIDRKIEHMDAAVEARRWLHTWGGVPDELA